MAFPTTGILDSFTRADTGPPPSTDWTTDVLGFGDSGLKVVSNQCIGNNSGSDNSGYWDTATFGADSEIYCTLVTRQNQDQYFALYIRVTSPGVAGADGYYVEYVRLSGTDTVSLYRIDNRAFTLLGSAISQDFADGDGFGAEMIGSTLAAYRNSGGWTQLGTRTDATYGTAGYIGVAAHDIAVFDNFGGGTVVAAAAGKFMTTNRGYI